MTATTLFERQPTHPVIGAFWNSRGPGFADVSFDQDAGVEEPRYPRSSRSARITTDPERTPLARRGVNWNNARRLGSVRLPITAKRCNAPVFSPCDQDRFPAPDAAQIVANASLQFTRSDYPSSGHVVTITTLLWLGDRNGGPGFRPIPRLPACPSARRLSRLHQD
jgi:hypothetical protein